jgi:hypothetical protein
VHLGRREGGILDDLLAAPCRVRFRKEKKKTNKAQVSHTCHPLGTPQLWFTVLERYHRTSCVVSNLIVGNSYAFRVFAENQCGLSDTAPVTADLAHIQKAGEEVKTVC